MRLRAAVKTVTGGTVHLADLEKSVLPLPVALEIQDDPDGCLLLRLDATGTCIADTWHRDAEEAKAQAAFEYLIYANEWAVVG